MTKAEQVRLTAWRVRLLRQLADEGNVARVCRRFGISRKSFYKWSDGTPNTGMRACALAHGPQRSPRATARELVS